MSETLGYQSNCVWVVKNKIPLEEKNMMKF